MNKLIIKTKNRNEVINITPHVEELLREQPARDGMLHLYLRHTTAALTTAYIEDDLDMMGVIDVIIPSSSLAKEHTHHMGHLSSHVIASMLGPHLALPVSDNKLMVGTFQAIALVELNGPRNREIVIYYKRKPRWRR